LINDLWVDSGKIITFNRKKAPAIAVLSLAVR
jgi:hypothetical protein